MMTKPTKKNNKQKRNSKQVFHLQKQMPVGFPKTNQVRLRYVEGISINAGTGTLGLHLFRANSCFDPNYTGTGHQPNGFDQWSAFYNHYVVTHSKITTHFTIDSSAAISAGIMVCGVSLTDDVTSTTSPSLMLEQSQTAKTTGVFNLYNNPRRVSKTYDPKVFFNVTDVNDNWKRLGALISANPDEEAYFTIYVGSPLSSLDVPSVNVLVEIEYTVMFSEPKELPES
jgi:hypothetical protein